MITNCIFCPLTRITLACLNLQNIWPPFLTVSIAQGECTSTNTNKFWYSGQGVWLYFLVYTYADGWSMLAGCLIISYGWQMIRQLPFNVFVEVVVAGLECLNPSLVILQFAQPSLRQSLFGKYFTCSALKYFVI